MGRGVGGRGSLMGERGGSSGSLVAEGWGWWVPGGRGVGEK